MIGFLVCFFSSTRAFLSSLGFAEAGACHGIASTSILHGHAGLELAPASAGSGCHGAGHSVMLGAEGRAQKQHRHKSHERMMVSLSERHREDTVTAGEASSSLPMLRAAGHAWNRAVVQPTRVSCARQAMARCADTILTE